MTVLPRTNHHVHNTGYVIFVTVVSPVLPLFIIRAPIKRMRNAISGVAWQLAGREGAASCSNSRSTEFESNVSKYYKSSNNWLSTSFKIYKSEEESVVVKDDDDWTIREDVSNVETG